MGASFREHKLYFLLLSISSGLLLGLAWYPFFTWCIFLGLAQILELKNVITKKNLRFPKLTLYAYTVLAFIVWNISVYWWLWYASEWMTLGAWIGNALLQALPVLLFYIIKKSSKNRFGYLAFICAWLAFEYLHLYWDFSWIWLNLGNAFGTHPAWVQWIEYTGTFGLALWAIFANILVFYIVFLPWWKGLVSLAIVLTLPLAVSYMMYFGYEESGENVECVVVQPNLDCYSEKFDHNPRTGEANVGMP